MAIKEVTPQQAHEILTNDTSVVYIDVRTDRESSPMVTPRAR